VVGSGRARLVEFSYTGRQHAPCQCTPKGDAIESSIDLSAWRILKLTRQGAAPRTGGGVCYLRLPCSRLLPMWSAISLCLLVTWTLVGPRNHMGSWTHPRGYKSPTKKGHFCRRHSSACPDMPAADILDILDVSRRNQLRCGQSQPLLQQPGARFTKYLTIYRKIIVSLS